MKGGLQGYNKEEVGCEFIHPAKEGPAEEDPGPDVGIDGDECRGWSIPWPGTACYCCFLLYVSICLLALLIDMLVAWSTSSAMLKVKLNSLFASIIPLIASSCLLLSVSSLVTWQCFMTFHLGLRNSTCNNFLEITRQNPLFSNFRRNSQWQGKLVALEQQIIPQHNCLHTWSLNSLGILGPFFPGLNESL